MILQTPLFGIPLKHISQSDSLRMAMDAMQIKVDNLEKIVQKTEIGTGFFWSVIALQLTVFVVIIGFAGLIGWRWFKNQIDQTKNDCKVSSENLINDHTLKYDRSIDAIRFKLARTIYNAARSMYFNAVKDSTDNYMLNWGISTVSAYLEVDGRDDDTLLMWIKKCISHLSKINIGDSVIKDNINNYLDVFKNIEAINPNQDIKSAISILKPRLLHICHTIPADNSLNNQPYPTE